MHLRTKRDAGICRYGLRNSVSQQLQGCTVVSLSQNGNRFASEAPGLSVWKDRFKTITDFDSIAMIIRGQKDENSSVRRFVANSPSLEEIDRITLNVSSIQRMNCDYCNLCFGFFIDLGAKPFKIGRRLRIEDVGEVIDVATRL